MVRSFINKNKLKSWLLFQLLLFFALTSLVQLLMNCVGGVVLLLYSIIISATSIFPFFSHDNQNCLYALTETGS